jgi:hypothetical protein
VCLTKEVVKTASHLASGVVERRHPAVATRHVRKDNGLFCLYTRDNIGKKKGSNTGAIHMKRKSTRGVDGMFRDVMRINSVEFGWQGDPSSPCKQCAKERP